MVEQRLYPKKNFEPKEERRPKEEGSGNAVCVGRLEISRGVGREREVRKYQAYSEVTWRGLWNVMETLLPAWTHGA